MARDKALDDRLFNCSQDWEAKQVAQHYKNEQEILDFLQKSCEKGQINRSTHLDVYKLIKNQFGYSIPV